MSWIVRIASTAASRATVIGGIVVLAAACARSTSPSTSSTPVPSPRPVPRVPVNPRNAAATRAPVPPPNPKLPAVPEIDGPLAIKVVYPPARALIASKDSNFIFGSVGSGLAGLLVNGTLVPVWPNGAFMGWVPNPKGKPAEYELVAFTARDTARYVHPVRTRTSEPPKPPVREKITPIIPGRIATLYNDSLERFVADTDRVIYGRQNPTGDYQWFLFPGTVVKMTGTLGDKTRVMLDSSREIWVDSRDVVLMPKSVKVASEQIEIKNATITPDNDWIDFRFPVGQPPAYAVEEPDENTISLIFYNTTTDPDEPLWSSSDPDPYLTGTKVRRTANRTIYTFTFSRPVYGYMAMYENGAMTFRMRRPPYVSRNEVLRGLTIVVDAGHPPAGATGPTGLYEPVPNLAIAEQVRAMLAARGATVIMTRTGDSAVPLGDRPIMARRANAHALVSIHLNALPDGMNPFRNNGTGTYYYHLHSKRFATLMQRAMLPQLGLRDLGVFRRDLALARPTWMPAVLAEGAFIIMPDQEAALRTPQYQRAYAQGVVNGLEAFFASFSR